MKYHQILFVLLAVFVIAGCQSSDPIRTMTYVDLERFSGDWYVLAAIPTFVERDSFDAVESYAPPVDGKIATTFRFRKGSFDGPEQVFRPMGFVREGTGNAVWGMQFVWPIKAEYRIVYVDDNYEYTIVGRTKRDYVWIMSRSPAISAAKYRFLTNMVAEEGYDVDRLRRVPHSQPD